MNDEKKPAPPAGVPSAPSPEDAPKEKTPELGYLELLRAPAEHQPRPVAPPPQRLGFLTAEMKPLTLNP